MLSEVVKELITLGEKTWLEYKSYWYWDQGASDLAKGWGEFMKDFSALFNVYNNDDKKYLILGVTDNGALQDYKTGTDGNTVNILLNQEELKKETISRIRKYFLNVPLYRGEDSLIGIETLFDIDIVQINDVDLLVFTIHPSPYLLELKVLLQGNTSFREKNIIIRHLKADGTPENRNASFEEVNLLQTYAEKKQNDDYPKKDTSIRKVVKIFKERISPTSEVSDPISMNDYSNGICFEIFRLTGEYVSPISFLYFSAYTSQNKTASYIKEKTLLNNSDRVIILTDKNNKKGGIIDKARIHELFSKSYPNTEVYHLEEFALKKLYNDLLDPELFYQNGFNISDFIKPYTNLSPDKTVDILLSEWYLNKKDPLLVLKGTGGIGKTTVVKYFLDSLRKNVGEDINILFINSHDIMNDIMRNPKIDDIYDFYKILAEKYNIKKKFDKDLLELSIDNGNVIIALDGIDEVIAKIGSKFNLNLFVKSIFEGYSENLEKTKIIITCRDYFWDKNTFPYQISSISLKPFSKELAQNYFSHHFNDERKSKKAMSLAELFVNKDGSNTYVPYILDMIKDDLLDDGESRRIDSSILKIEENINDYLVGKVCEREIIKLSNSSIDKQLEVFTTMAVRFNGVLHDSQLENFVSRKGFSIGDMEKFKDHPLLILDTKENVLRFRYDFFDEYFKNIALSAFLNSVKFEGITEEIIDIIIQYVGYENDFMKSIKKRFNMDVFEDFKLAILGFLSDDLGEINYLTSYKRNQLRSSLFVILLCLEDVNNKEDRTSIFKDLFEKEKDVIEHFCLINLHTNSGKKLIFDFSGLTLKNCYFENYEFFSECSFDDKTMFLNTDFIAPLSREGISPNISRTHIDEPSCDISGIAEIFYRAEETADSRESVVRKDLKRIFSFFWQGGYFKQKLASEANKKLRDIHQVLEVLIRNKVLVTKTVTTKQKREDKAFALNVKYSNLRKIMEENETCYEFEEIVKMFK